MAWGIPIGARQVALGNYLTRLRGQRYLHPTTTTGSNAIKSTLPLGGAGTQIGMPPRGGIRFDPTTTTGNYLGGLGGGPASSGIGSRGFRYDPTSEAQNPPAPTGDRMADRFAKLRWGRQYGGRRY